MQFMAKDWIWKRLTGEQSSARLEEAHPDYLQKPDGNLVRTHAPHPIAPPDIRLKKKIKLALYDGEEWECWEWQGGDTFRVSLFTVTTPARFAYEYSTGEVLKDNESLYQMCKGWNCIRPIHQVKAKTGTHGEPLLKKAFYMT